jgi:hypothetical protein
LSGSRGVSRPESTDRAARITPSAPKRVPIRASGQERSRGKRRPTREIPSRVALVAAARACSYVRKGAPLFWSAALPTLTMVADEPEPLPTTPRRAPRFEVSIGRSGRTPSGARFRQGGPPWRQQGHPQRAAPSARRIRHRRLTGLTLAKIGCLLPIHPTSEKVPSREFVKNVSRSSLYGGYAPLLRGV